MPAPSPEHRLALPTGASVGPYRIEGLLGDGGFGITYLAEHTGLQRKVALKELLPVDLATRIENATIVARTMAQEGDFDWARDRFIEESRTLAKFQHPNIIAVHDVFEANGTAYMATAYEEGCDLAAWLKRSQAPPSESEVRAILEGLLNGLETVHAQQLLHRDIKPANIYICADGRPVLLDFGSARQAISSKSRPITSIVTPGYAPFEQYHEDGNQGPWTDLYALGAVVVFLLTGEKPPDATRRVRNDPYVPLATRLRGKYSPGLLVTTDRALEPREEDRPQSVKAWRETFLGEQLPDRRKKVVGPPPLTTAVPQSAQVLPPPPAGNGSQPKRTSPQLPYYLIYGGLGALPISAIFFVIAMIVPSDALLGISCAASGLSFMTAIALITIGVAMVGGFRAHNSNTKTNLEPPARDRFYRFSPVAGGSRDSELLFSYRDLTANGGTFTLGRVQGECQLIIDDSSVSRLHLRFSVDPVSGHLMLEDLGSGNGTYLNGKKISQPKRLSLGDTVGIGAVELVFAEGPSEN